MIVAPLPLHLMRALCLWAGALAWALLGIIPMDVYWRALSMLLVAALVMIACKRMARCSVADDAVQCTTTSGLPLPPTDYDSPVVLVCGDIAGLFGTLPAGPWSLRVTDGGCYVAVPSVEQLSRVSAELLALRPGWHGQLSVMLVVNPAAHVDRAVLAGQLRSFCYQLASLRRQGRRLPWTLVSYIQAARGAGPWFTWESGRSGADVHEAGACVSLGDWQRQAPTSAMASVRLQGAVQLDSATTWLTEHVLNHLLDGSTRHALDLPAVCVLTLVPQVPGASPGNLWQGWLRQQSGLVGSAPASTTTVLRFPDPVLALLPVLPRYTSKPRASVIALWIFSAAAAMALISSAWQNHRLLHQVADDLRHYYALTERGEAAMREAAVDVLRGHAQRLDRYHRYGPSLSLGLGLYRGNTLRPPLLAAIGGHPVLPSASMDRQVTQSVRLDSLSLFASGSAELKPQATKVLVAALVEIKAQPGWLILIAGHTDATGNPDSNLLLSRSRAVAVRDWMQRMGDLPGSCFAVQGYGDSQPIASNDTETGRTANRRVDIRLVPEAGACALSASGPGRSPPSHSAAYNHR